MEINCTWVGINSSLFLCGEVDGSLVAAHVIHGRRLFVSRMIFSEHREELGNTFLEAAWKERKTAVMNLNGGKKVREI